MKRVTFTGYSQIKHLQQLFSAYGYKTDELECKTKTGKLARRLRKIIQIFRTDLIYFVGEFSNNNLYFRLARLFHKRIIIHWIGTDVWKAIHGELDTKGLTGKRIFHLAGSELLRDELTAVGISATVIPIIPLKMNMDIQPAAEKHAALVYMPEGKEDFYGVEWIAQLCELNPDIPFHIVANQYTDRLNFPNVIFHGRVSLEEMNEIYKSITMLIRFPEHDGLSLMVLEALSKGKQVLYKYQHPFVHTPKSMTIADINFCFHQVIDNPPSVNIEGSEYVKHYYTKESIWSLYQGLNIFKDR